MANGINQIPLRNQFDYRYCEYGEHIIQTTQERIYTYWEHERYIWIIPEENGYGDVWLLWDWEDYLNNLDFTLERLASH